ncbi:ATP-binding protein [Actinomadura parmotrematis]|nr:ATP-binding protein [Actinomadura parmotrematis]
MKLPTLVATLSLQGKPESVPAARRWFRATLGPDHPAADDVELAGCELVTNALLHSESGHGGHIALILDADENRVRVHVTDDGTATEPRAGNVTMCAESGRGLLMVEALTHDWGTHHQADGRTTWFEISLPGLGG